MVDILPKVVFGGGFQGVHTGNRLVSPRHHPIDVLLPGAGLGLELDQEPDTELRYDFTNTLDQTTQYFIITFSRKSEFKG